MPSANFNWSDLGNAKRMIKLHGCRMRFVKEWGWLIWTGTHWQLDNKGEVGLMAKDTIAKIYVEAGEIDDDDKRKALANWALKSESRGAINAMIALAENEPEIRLEVADFDNNPDLLNCSNGVVNLRTGKITPHNSNQHFTYCINTPYEPDTDRTEWLNFLDGVVGGGQEVIDYVQMALGYTFTGHTREECLFYIHGPTRSGKGTFTETLYHLFGTPLSIEVDFNTFTAKRDQDANNFDLAHLKPARAIFASESNRFQSLNPAKIKQLTGGNLVRCCFKHKDFFEYRPQFKVWLSSNWELNADVDDDALWYRPRIINFPNSHEGTEDKGLKDRMKSPKNLKGVLSWIVEGAIKWYALPNGLVTPEPVKEMVKKHRELSDYVQAWLEECTERDETKWTPNQQVMASYTRWCKDNNVEPKSAKALATSLRAKGYLPGVVNKFEGTTSRGVQGLRFI